MVNLEIPWINVMSKMDLVTSNTDEPAGGARNGVRGRKNIARYVFRLDWTQPFPLHLFRVSCSKPLSRSLISSLTSLGVLFSISIQLPCLDLCFETCFRYLDPDPLLLASARGGDPNPSNPRFHALNQAIVQLVCSFRKLTLH